MIFPLVVLVMYGVVIAVIVMIMIMMIL
jgi:hypothetical protein